MESPPSTAWRAATPRDHHQPFAPQMHDQRLIVADRVFHQLAVLFRVGIGQSVVSCPLQVASCTWQVQHS